MVVPGIGFNCFAPWLNPPDAVGKHLRQFGYDGAMLSVDALSSSTYNARQIRDAVMATPLDPAGPRLVLIGYSKGAPDIPRSPGQLPGDPRPRGGGGQRGGRGGRLATGQLMPSSIRPICSSTSPAPPASPAMAAA